MPFLDDIKVGSEYYDQVSSTLGELHERGFYKPSDESWRFDLGSDERYSRVCGKLLDRYWYREIGVMPLFRFKQQYLRIANEQAPKFALLYDLVESGFDILQARDEYEKRRNIYSAFPATLLTGNQDYASDGTDAERERVVEGAAVDMILRFADGYEDPDVLFIEKFDILFSCIVSPSVPLY